MRTTSRHLRFGLPVVAAIGMYAAIVEPVAAQEPERGVPVRERSRADYDSVGIRAGGFLLFPSLEIGVRHESNLYRTENQEKEDTVLTFGHRLTAVSQWSNHELVFDAAIEADRHHTHRDEDSVDGYASARGRLDITRDTAVEADVYVERLHEDRGDPNTAATTSPGIYTRYGADAQASHRFNRISLAAEGSVTDLAHRSRDQADRDRRESDLTLQAGYMFLPEFEVFARATGIERTYERRQGRFDRDSEGWEVVAGAEADLGGIVSGEVFAGYLRQKYEAPVLPTVEGSAFGGSLNWNVTPLTTVSALLRRSVEESVLAASGFLATHGEVAVDHELLRNLVLSTNLSLARSDYEAIPGGDDRSDDVVGIYIGGLWLLDRYEHVDFGYQVQHRGSTVSGEDYTSRVLSLNLRLKF